MPKVAIVGRPNVGKSTLFNRVVGRRSAIVEGRPEITRDRVSDTAVWRGKTFTLIDTGGFVPKDKHIMRKLVAEQTQQAIDEADLILFMVNGREGLNALDEDIALLLKKTKKKVYLLVNKLDSLKDEEKIYEFYRLKFEHTFPISAEHGLNTADLLDVICANIEDVKTPDRAGITAAIVGCPNVGKSSLFNALLRQKRSIVHDIPGTTRDAINTEIIIGEDAFLFIDTAGLREKRKVTEEVEYYSNLRTVASINRAEVVLLLVDSSLGPRAQDKKIAALINQHGKASIIISSKWDLIERQSTKDEIKKYKNFYIEKLKAELVAVNYSPVVFTSTLTNKGLGEVYKNIKDAYAAYINSVDTPHLNRFIKNTMLNYPPISSKGKFLKIYYSYQRGTKPPVFVFKCNDTRLARPSYLKFLEKKLRENFNFTGSPIKMIMQKSK